MAARELRLTTDDGVELEAELDGDATSAGVAVVLCHPHPQMGGTMRSIVTSVLFNQLPAAGYPCLRFNFRGVEGSTGEHSYGEHEPLDAVAAIAAISEAVPDLPIALVGWSFGADIALGVADARVSGWVAIAPPLRVLPSFAAAQDARPKHLILGEHDEVRAPADVQAEVASWRTTTVAVIPGASHFFMGRTDAVVSETRGSRSCHRAVSDAVPVLQKEWAGGETVHLEERLPLACRQPPRCEIAVECGAVAVFVRVLELVERAVLGVEKRSVSAEEVIVNRNPVR